MEKASKCKEPSAKTNWPPPKCAEPQLTGTGCQPTGLSSEICFSASS